MQKHFNYNKHLLKTHEKKGGKSMLNDSKIQALFEELKPKAVENKDMTIDERMEGYFYAVSIYNTLAGIVVIYTDKRMVFVEVNPMGEPEDVIISQPHDIKNIQVREKWLFYHVIFQFTESKVELRANKKVSGFKKQGGSLSKLSEIKHRYFIGE